MRFVVVTGVAGAGKTAEVKMMGDAEDGCVDDVPN